MTDEEVRALLGDAGVYASWLVYDVYNETEHAYRMTESARYNIGAADVQRAIEDLEVVKAAANRAASRAEDAIDALKALPARETP